MLQLLLLLIIAAALMVPKQSGGGRCFQPGRRRCKHRRMRTTPPKAKIR